MSHPPGKLLLVDRDVLVAIKDAGEAAAEVLAADLDCLTGDELSEVVMAAQRLLSQMEAVCCRAAGVFDARQEWAASGAKGAAAWVAWKCRVARPRATAQVKQARALRLMSLVEAAFAAGEISADHVQRLAFAQHRNPDAFSRDEGLLVGWATSMRFSHFNKALNYWLQHADPDGAEADASRDHERRRAHCSPLLDGMVRLDALFEPIGGEIFSNELTRLEELLFKADCQEAETALGRKPTLAELGRTPAQRRADALVEMARRSAASDGSGTARPLFSVLCGYTAFSRICELASGTVVTPGQLAPYISDAEIQRVIFDGPSRVLDVGVNQRFFTGATRRAIQIRDRTCTHPSCDIPAARCEIDHIQPWIENGPTDQANGHCLCKYHHRLRQKKPPDINPP